MPQQIEQECVYPEGFDKSPDAQKGKRDTSIWGGEDGNFS
ncbi:hypothetical protein BMETH_115611192238, partial [methanotrophic bacterial endosymbiont of Bathymodiolus sp.]